MVKLSSYINVLHPNKFQQFLEDEKEVDYSALTLNIIIIAVLSVFVRFYSSLVSPSGTFSLLSVIWPIMGFFIFIWVLDFLAIRFGAKGNFLKLCYLLSILLVSVNLITTPLYLLMPSGNSALALIGCIILLPLLAVGIYSLYRHYKIFCSVYPSLSGRNPLIVYIITFGVMFAISLVLVSFFNFS